MASAVVLGAVSCKEKPKAIEAPTEDHSVIEKVKEVKEAITPPAATISNEERAAKLGFAKYLPADTEMVMSVYNAKEATEQFKALKL